MIKPRVIALLTLLFVATAAVAQDDSSVVHGNGETYYGFVAIILMLVLFMMVMAVVLSAFRAITRVALPGEGMAAVPVIAKVMPDYFHYKSKSNWFVILLVPTLGLMAIYLLVNYFSGSVQPAINESAVAKSPLVAKNPVPPSGSPIDENTVKLVTTSAVLDSGKAVFQTNCAACHGDKGQGVVGPNLTDDYWLHGGKITDVFKTVKNGVLDKGMPAWDKQISAQNISDVSNFIESLRGTNPPGAKAPQGVKE